MAESHSLSFAGEILWQFLGQEPTTLTCQRLNGGCINDAFKLEADQGRFFLKYNVLEFSSQFEQESRALNLLRKTQAFTVPEVLQTGEHGSRSYLLMEYINPAAPSSKFWELFGQNLAKLHRTSSPDHTFGLSFDNHIGALPQKNTYCDDWIDFFIQNRLEVQLTLALYNELIDKAFVDHFRQLYDQLPGLLVSEPSSLIHGDLWSGNFLCGKEGATLIDPAVYFANREIELAFTKLFGGFAPEFYYAYQQAWPLQPGFEERAEIYNLYPLLVHVNLFGSSYLSGVERVVRRYT